MSNSLKISYKATSWASNGMESCTRILLYHPNSDFLGMEVSWNLGGLRYQVWPMGQPNCILSLLWNHWARANLVSTLVSHLASWNQDSYQPGSVEHRFSIRTHDQLCDGQYLGNDSVSAFIVLMIHTRCWRFPVYVLQRYEPINAQLSLVSKWGVS